jgi:hypothetical protein
MLVCFFSPSAVGAISLRTSSIAPAPYPSMPISALREAIAKMFGRIYGR